MRLQRVEHVYGERGIQHGHEAGSSDSDYHLGDHGI